MPLPHELTPIDENTVALRIDTTVYSRHAVLRACYKYTDRCYVFLAHDPTPAFLVAVFSRKDQDTDLDCIVGEFSNELLDQELRDQVAAETADVRTLIVAQAFAEGNLLDESR